jgi:hypothetical protein
METRLTYEEKDNINAQKVQLKAIGPYIDAHTNRLYECLICGVQKHKKPNKVQQGRGCYGCGRKRIGVASRTDLEIVKTIILSRNYIYNYHFYKNGQLWINVTCPDRHEARDRRWSSFKKGRGCQECGRISSSETHKMDIDEVKAEIVKRAYIYNYHFYKEDDLWINISCPGDHGPGDKKWNNFQQGQDCYKCALLKRTVYKNDICKKLSRLLRTRLNHALCGRAKNGSAVRDLGCSLEFLFEYLETKFQLGMTWKNRGKNGWEVDHIRPLSSFDLENREELLKACHYTNLQPLWAIDNVLKGAKY